MQLRLVTRIALLSAIAAVVMWIEFSLPYLPPFLKYDPSDAVALLGTLSLGPVAGVLIELLKNLLRWLVVGGNPVGFAANFFAGGTLVLAAGLLHRRDGGFGRTGLALLAGCVAMAAVMIPANYYLFLPPHGITGPRAASLILTGLIPFNFFKALISSVLALAAYARLAGVIALPTRTAAE